jgi:HPt (histidine-containing phosphotransfer) domain-containing protein
MINDNGCNPMNKTEMPHIPEFLPGLNTGEGIQRMGGAADIYANLVMYFCNDKKDFCRRFRELVGKNDFKTAEIEAHALKGAAATISAAKLSRLAKLLENKCEDENREEIMKVLQSIEEALAQVMESSEKISCLFPAEDIINSGRNCPPSCSLRELLQKLDKNLQESDPVESERCIIEIAGFYQSDNSDEQTSKIVRELARQINDFNFESAREILHKLREHIQTQETKFFEKT